MRAARRSIPSFSLYGERSSDAQPPPDLLHIEDIQSRSRKYLWTISSHRHVGLQQCVFVASGPVVADVEHGRKTLRGPAVIAVPAGTIHGFAFSAESQGFVLTAPIERLLETVGLPQRRTITDFFAAPRIIDLQADAGLAMRLESLFGQLLHEFRQPDGANSPTCGWLACAALWLLGSEPRALQGAGGAGGDGGQLHRFRQLLEAHVADHWPVERYARAVGISETTLNRLCRRRAGATAFELVQRRLNLEARRRLVYVAASVAAIAADLGFEDSAYFCRFFRRRNGTSPAAFRRLQSGG